MKILSLFLLLLSTVFGQTREDILEEYIKERNKMMEEITKMFNEDMESMLDDDFFKMDGDDFFYEKSFQRSSNNVSIEQNFKNNGDIDILITPKNEHVQLDISTNDSKITIKSEMKVSNESEGSKVLSESSETKIISIPRGYIMSKPIYKNKKIIISLSANKKLKDLKKEKASGKVPLKPRPGDDTL